MNVKKKKNKTREKGKEKCLPEGDGREKGRRRERVEKARESERMEEEKRIQIREGKGREGKRGVQNCRVLLK